MEISKWLETQLQRDIWSKKYRNGDETFDQWLDRVSNSNPKIKDLIVNKQFLPAGRILANKGLQDIGKKITYSNCFVKNQMVTTQRGLIPIQKVIIGDYVLCDDNTWSEVVNLSNRLYEGDLYRIKTKYNFKDLICTPNHQVMTRDGWKRVDRLIHKNRGLEFHDEIKITKVDGINNQERVLDLSQFILSDDKYNVEVLDYTLVISRINSRSKRVYKSDRYITLDSDLYYLIGRFIGDGWLNYSEDDASYIFGIVFNSLNEMHSYEKCKEIIESKFECETSCYEPKDSHSIVLNTKSIVGFKLLEVLVGRYSTHKSIPEIMIGNLDVVLGILDSDGGIDKNGVIRIGLKNAYLIEQIRETLLLNNIISSESKVVSNGIKINKSKTFKSQTFVNKKMNRKLMPLLSKCYTDLRLNKVHDKIIDYNEVIDIIIEESMEVFVYNLEVKNIHSYTVNGLMVKNCYVLPPPQDNIESIFNTGKELARTFSYGGGVGLSLRDISPKGMRLNNAAKETTGTISFMQLYSDVTEAISQQGRRGALMLSMPISHPDIIDFINIKTDLTKVTKANISIEITDEFMIAVREDQDYTMKFTRTETGETISNTINARELFKIIAKNNWDYAEPGILFWNNIQKWNLLSEDDNFEYAGVNPCIPLGQYILTPTGYKKIQDVDGKISLCGRHFECSELIPSGYKNVVEIRTECGNIIRVSENHKILTKNGDKFASTLTDKDELAMDFKPIHNFVINNYDEYEKGIVVGWFIRHCVIYYDSYILTIRPRHKQFKDELIKYLSKYFTNLEIYQKNNKTNISLKNCPELSAFIENVLYNQDLHNVDILNRSKDFKIGIIKVFITSGRFDTKNRKMFRSLSIKDDYRQLQLLLAEFGILTSRYGNHWKRISFLENGLHFIGALTSSVNFEIKTMQRSIDFKTKKSYQKVDYVKPLGVMPVYDINVPKTGRFNLNSIVVHNCAEEPLPAYGSCNLGSINLSEFVANEFTLKAKFDYYRFNSAVKESVIYLNEILDEGQLLHPLKPQQEVITDWRQIGLGIFGLADMLIKMQIRYGSDESIDVCRNIAHAMVNKAVETSALLAKDQGTYKMYNKEAILKSEFLKYNCSNETIDLVRQYGLRNSQLLTIAPTGSLSTLFGVSGGIEPIFETHYTRKTESLHGEDVYYDVFTPIVDKYMKLKNITKEELPDFFVTSMNLDYKERIKMQAVWQRSIDASISSTVNLNEDATIEDVEELYMLAWEHSLKGITVFRNNCKRLGILTTPMKKEPVVEPANVVESVTYANNSQVHYIDSNGKSIEIKVDTKQQELEVPTGLLYTKYKLRTGCGNLYLFVGADYKNKKIYDIFVNTDGTSGCMVNTISNARLISKLLRLGCPLEDIVKQLNSSGTCNSYTNSRTKQLAYNEMLKKDISDNLKKELENKIGVPISKGKSCSSAIANILIDINNKFISKNNEAAATDPLVVNLPYFPVTNNVIIKPLSYENIECKHENMRFQEGCNVCPDCGYSKCD